MTRDSAAVTSATGDAAPSGEDVSKHPAVLGEATPAPSDQVSVTSERPAPRQALLEQEGEIAADYLEGLLDIADIDGDIDMDVEADRALVAIVGASLDDLVGRGGEVLDALQELTRLAVLRETGERSRLMLDVGSYRARRRDELGDLGRRTAQRVKDTGERVELRPMTPFERKVVHDAVATVGGVRSESEGVEPERYVVVIRE